MLLFTLFVVICSLISSSTAQWDPNCDGKQVIVHLFEWKWVDIAEECERFLGPAGYCGFQVSPPMEHVILPNDNYPWWQRYQPVSYILHSRSGTPEEFADMVRRCNAVGVRTFVDAVINHMAGLGRIGVSYAGSTYDSSAFDFPGVPFRAEHFTPRSMCNSGSGNVDNYADANNVRNCFLVGLTDLYGADSYVRAKVTEYLNHLVSLGVAGIRIDAAKHMWPQDILAMTGPVNNLPTEHGFPAGSKLFVYSEVIDRDDGAVRVNEYYDVGLVTEFRYCQKMAWGIFGDYGQLNEIPDYGWGMAKADRAFVFVDNHDNQRGHGGAGDVVTHKVPREYKQAIAFMLAYDYGFPQVMSSYSFDNPDQGPPHNADWTTADVIINDDGSCGGGWVCEHRWNVIAKMVEFRNKVHGAPVGNKFIGGGVAGFSRGNKGFFLMAKSGSYSGTPQTGMPGGEYCNIIDGCATKVKVNSDGTASITINNYEEPILAICVGCSADPIPTIKPPPRTTTSTLPTVPCVGNNCPTASTASTRSTASTPTTVFVPPTAPCVGAYCPTKPPSSFERTVVFVAKQTAPGENLFLRGGLGSEQHPECPAVQDYTSSCAIPIEVNSLGDAEHYDGYNAYRIGDDRLDWGGAQPTQGTLIGVKASGTAMAWTTTNQTHPGYQPLNTWGEHLWMVDFEMDCSKTEDGWFEMKTLIDRGTIWEGDITQKVCTGAGAATPPYTSKNHMARCGFVNKFNFGTGDCEILTF